MSKQFFSKALKRAVQPKNSLEADQVAFDVALETTMRGVPMMFNRQQKMGRLDKPVLSPLVNINAPAQLDAPKRWCPPGSHYDAVSDDCVCDDPMATFDSSSNSCKCKETRAHQLMLMARPSALVKPASSAALTYEPEDFFLLINKKA